MSCHPLHLEGSRPHYLFYRLFNSEPSAKAYFPSTASMNPGVLMEILWLTEEEVKSLLTMDEAITAVEKAFY